MSAADDVLVEAGKRNGQVYPVRGSDGGCATFVSAVFGATGNGSIFGSSSSVPAIVARFPADRILTLGVIIMAGPADLIVFGADEHIGIYAGNGLVWNTNSAGGTNKVQLQDVSSIRTITGRGFSKILKTGLSNNSGTVVGATKIGGLEGGLVNAGNDTAGIFGALFAWVPGFAVAALVIVFAAVLALEGGRMMLESTEGD